MSKILGFGETLPEYDVPVLNEREVRAAAGLLFLFALVSFMNSWLLGDFHFTRIFVVAFLVDFSVRVAVNPRYAPSMILARLAVGRQAPEWVGAPQKRFAWSIAWLLAALMLDLIVVHRIIGPFNLLICAICLTLMFFESAFGICLACKLYELFLRDKARYCPGGVCDVGTRHPSQTVGLSGIMIVALFGALIVLVSQRWLSTLPPVEAAPAPIAQPSGGTVDPCTPPDWAVKIGHAQMWRLHHGCKL